MKEKERVMKRRKRLRRQGRIGEERERESKDKGREID